MRYIIINHVYLLQDKKMKNSTDNFTTPRVLHIDGNLNLTPEKMYLLAKFCAFCASTIPVHGELKIKVVNNRDYHGITTTAAYKVGKNELVVYGKNRALVDICRSIAHEMVHLMQDEQGLIDGPVRDIGGFHENQANAGAGALIKSFAQSQSGGREIYESTLKITKILV
tara:strand:+ start:4014 stop:4520 length:507 start_codon:yes stop_codon:yes gene_type:complete